jgi:hypothetical protein
MLPEAAPVARALAYNFFHDLYFKEADVMSASLFYKKVKKCLFAYGQDLKTKVVSGQRTDLIIILYKACSFHTVHFINKCRIIRKYNLHVDTINDITRF